MNRLKIYFLLTVLTSFSTISCKKSFLEIVPKGNLVASTTNDYDLLLNNLDLFNINASPPVLMGDEVASMEAYFATTSAANQRLFRWDKDIYEVDQDASEFTSAVKSLYTYNKIINEVMNASGGTDALKRSVRAEALTGRAWTNFIMINLYGKPYQAATAATDPGFPLLMKADVTAKEYTRASVKEVYDQIINDLTTAIPDLPAVTFRTRMSKSAGEAILGKVYMFMGRFNDALPLLNNAFSDLAGAAVNVRLYDYNVTMAPGGSFLPISATNGPAYPLLPANEESVLARQHGNPLGGFSNLGVLKKEMADLFQPSDLRLNFFTPNIYPSGGQFVNGMLRRRGPSNVQFAVVLPDMYLLRAECKARLNDMPGSVSDLEALRIKRMPAADAQVPATAKTSTLSLLNFVLEERVREFALTGFRWYDMRRLSTDPLFAGRTYTHTLFLTNGGNTIFTLAPERFALRLPLKVIAANPGMTQNP